MPGERTSSNDSFSRRALDVLLIFAVFAAVAAWPVPDSNEAHYVSKAIHFWNPERLHGDLFLNSADAHTTFYVTFGWLSYCLSPTAMVWTGRILTWALLAWAWRRFARVFFAETYAIVLSAAVFAFLLDKFAMAGEWVVGGVEAKGFAYVFFFLGLEAVFRGRWNRGWLCFGASSAFHALVGGWAVVAVAVAWFVDRRRYPTLKSMLPGLVGGALLSLPGVVPCLLLNADCSAETAREANEILVFERLPHHLNLLQIDPKMIFSFVTLGVFCLYFRLRSHRRRKSEATAISPSLVEKNHALTTLDGFVFGALAIATVGVGFSFLAMLDRPAAASLLRFYWFRMSDVAVPLGVAILTLDAFSYMTAKMSAAKRLSAMVAFAMLWAIANGPTIYGVLSLGRPRFDQYSQEKDWIDVCLWASRNTTEDEIFLAPRMSRTFIWFARRAEAVSWKNVPQDAKGVVEWRARMEDVYATGANDPESMWHEDLAELGSARLKAVAAKYNVSYAIASTSTRPLPLEIAYQNGEYTVYRVKERAEGEPRQGNGKRR